jgi:hypothetical protein
MTVVSMKRDQPANSIPQVANEETASIYKIPKSKFDRASPLSGSIAGQLDSVKQA